MPLELDDLPTVESAGRLGRRAGAGTPLGDAYQIQTFDRGLELSSLLFSLGTEAMGLLQNKVLPSSAKLAALFGPAAVTYTTYPDCASFNYDGTCNSPCFGYAPDHMSSFFCATCAEQAADPNNNPPWN